MKKTTSQFEEKNRTLDGNSQEQSSKFNPKSKEIIFDSLSTNNEILNTNTINNTQKLRKSSKKEPIYDSGLIPITELTPEIIIEWVFANGRGNMRMTQFGPILGSSSEAFQKKFKETTLSNETIINSLPNRPHTSVSGRIKTQKNNTFRRSNSRNSFQTNHSLKANNTKEFSNTNINDSPTKKKNNFFNSESNEFSDKSIIVNKKLVKFKETPNELDSIGKENQGHINSSKSHIQNETTSTSNSTLKNESETFKIANTTKILYPRTGARLFLLIHNSHHLARNSSTGELVLASRNFRKARQMTHHELVSMLQNEESDFIKDIYLRKNKLVVTDKEELYVKMASDPLVRWALDIDPKELEQLLTLSQSGKIPVERQLIEKYKKLQERTTEEKITIEKVIEERLSNVNHITWSNNSFEIKSPNHKKEITDFKPNSILKSSGTQQSKYNLNFSWKRGYNREPTDFQEKKPSLFIKQVNGESLHSFFQRVIENERTRRLNFLLDGKIDIKQLRDPTLFDKRKSASLPQNQVFNMNDLSNFQMLSKRLRHSFKITDIGDRAAVQGSTQNIKLIRDL